MKSTAFLHRILVCAGLAAFLLIAAAPTLQTARAQSPERAPTGNPVAAHRHVDGLALEHRGDEKGAFVAFLEAAESGYAPAQRRLGEIYDTGNSAVERDYEESIRWYQKAREGGEKIPPPRQRMPFNTAP